MAFLHCHDCDWQQDDFWSLNGHNPLGEERMAELRKDLLEPEIELGPSDEQPRERLTGRQFVVRELTKLIRRISRMAVPTSEEFERLKKGWTCPACGSSNWDID